MREVIQKVIATETDAKQLVQAAQTEADQLLNSARLRARDLADQAHGEAKLEAEIFLAATEAEATREKADRLADAAAEINTNIRLDAAIAQPAVEAGVRCVRGFPLKGNNSS
jgi:vacuolar-type H+-ATPase subunit H